MRGLRTRGGVIAAASLILCSLPIGPGSVSDGAEDLDCCEIKARQAYWEALKLCQLATDPNPRLRCQEAARAVYVSTLEACRGRGRIEAAGTSRGEPNKPERR